MLGVAPGWAGSPGRLPMLGTVGGEGGAPRLPRLGVDPGCAGWPGRLPMLGTVSGCGGAPGLPRLGTVAGGGGHTLDGEAAWASNMVADRIPASTMALNESNTDASGV
jgi:hypothetical protein